MPTRRSLRILAAFAALLVLSAVLLPRSSWAQQREPLASIEAKSEDVRQVLQQLAATAGINLVMDDTLTSRITLKLQNVPLEQALESIAKAAGATVTHEGGVYLFLNSRTAYVQRQPPTEPNAVQVLDLSQTDYAMALQLIQAVAGSLKVEGFPELKAVVISGPYNQVNTVRSAVDTFLRNRPGQAAPQQQVLRVVPLSYADPYETASAVQGQFSRVRVVPVRGSNSLVVNGPPEQVEAVVNAIKSLDHTPALIAFEVEMVEVDSDAARTLGIDWWGAQGTPIFSLSWKEADPIMSPLLTSSATHPGSCAAKSFNTTGWESAADCAHTLSQGDLGAFAAVLISLLTMEGVYDKVSNTVLHLEIRPEITKGKRSINRRSAVGTAQEAHDYGIQQLPYGLMDYFFSALQREGSRNGGPRRSPTGG